MELSEEEAMAQAIANSMADSPVHSGPLNERLAQQLQREESAAAQGSADDVALARRLQKEMEEEDEPRAPDPIRSEALLSPGGFVAPSQHRNHEVETFRDFAGEAAGTKGLGALFRPPVDLLFTGSFDELRSCGTGQLRYLIVNIQSVTEFASHVLNRDVWADKQLRALISNSCLLWQFYQSEPQAQQFCSLYPACRQSFPQVALIDPRTGELLHNWSAGVEATAVTAKIEELIRFKPLQHLEPRAAKRARVEPRADPDEQEMLAAAIAASLHETKDGADPVSPQPIEIEPDAVAVLEPVEEPEEPAAGVKATKLKIRLPDHTWTVRKFALTDTIGRVLQFVKWKVPEACSKVFELNQSHPARTLDAPDETLEESGLRNAQLLANWVEEEE